MFIKVEGKKLEEVFLSFEKFYQGSVTGKVIKIQVRGHELILSGLRSDYIEMTIDIKEADIDDYECLIDYVNLSYILSTDEITIKFMSTSLSISSDFGNMVIQYSYSDEIVKPQLTSKDHTISLNQYDMEKLKKLTTIEVLARALKKTFPVSSYGKTVVINTAMVAIQADVSLPIGVYTIEQIKRVVAHGLYSVTEGNRIEFSNSNIVMISTTSKLTEENLFDKMLPSFEYLTSITYDLKTIQSMSAVMKTEMATVDICENAIKVSSSTDKFSVNYIPENTGVVLYRFNYSYQILSIILNILGGECKVWKKGSVLCLMNQGINILMSV
jgi:hypothetical protein